MKIIFIAICVFAGGISADSLGEPCKVPDGDVGSGKFYKDCLALFGLEKTPANKELIQKSVLEKPGGKVIVCCPNPKPSAPKCKSQREGALGSCIALPECKQLSAMVKHPPWSPPTREFLKKSQCGFFNGKPLVCCAEEDVDNDVFVPEQQPITTSTTTTTTTTEAPKEVDEDAKRLLEKIKAKSDLLPTAPACGTSMNDRIFGGIVSTIYDYNWIVLLEYTNAGKKKDFKCGGSLINARYVLTAGHCLNPTGWSLTSVRVGEQDLDTPEDCDPNEENVCLPAVQDIGIAKRIPHPQYKMDNKNSLYDIALLRLKWNVQPNNFTQPICLPLARHLWKRDYSGEYLTAAGFGRTEDGTSSSNKLQVDLPFVDFEKCEEDYSGLKTLMEGTQICAGKVLGKDTCLGDSGGPLMIKDLDNDFGPHYIAGIVSYGAKPCGTLMAGVYTDVANYLEWIVDNIRK